MNRYYKLNYTISKRKVGYAYLMTDGKNSTLIHNEHIITFKSNVKVIKKAAIAYKLLTDHISLFTRKMYKIITESQFEAQRKPHYKLLDIPEGTTEADLPLINS